MCRKNPWSGLPKILNHSMSFCDDSFVSGWFQGSLVSARLPGSRGHETCWQWLHSISNCVTAGTNAFLSDDCEQWLESATGRHSRCLSGGRCPGQETRAAVLESSFWVNPRSTRWSSDSHSWKHLWFERCIPALVEDIWCCHDCHRFHSEHVRCVCVCIHRGAVSNLEGILCVHVDDTICGGSVSLFSESLTVLRHRFPFRKWHVGEGMFRESKYVQNKDTKEIMISQTDFAIKVTKVPISPVKIENAKGSCWQCWDPCVSLCEREYQLVGWSNTSGCVLSSVSIAADPTTTDSCSGLCIKHGSALSPSACRLGSQDQANACTKHDVAVACRCVVEHWRSCWLAAWLHLWCYRQVIAG